MTDYTGEHYPEHLKYNVRIKAKQIAIATVFEMRKVPKRVLDKSQIAQELIGSLGEQIFYHVFKPFDPTMKQKKVLIGHGDPDGDFVFLNHTIEVKASRHDGHLLLKDDRPIDAEYYVFCWIDIPNKWGILRGFCTADRLRQDEHKIFGKSKDMCYNVHKSQLTPMSQLVTTLH